MLDKLLIFSLFLLAQSTYAANHCNIEIEIFRKSEVNSELTGSSDPSSNKFDNLLFDKIRQLSILSYEFKNIYFIRTQLGERKNSTALKLEVELIPGSVGEDTYILGMKDSSGKIILSNISISDPVRDDFVSKVDYLTYVVKHDVKTLLKLAKKVSQTCAKIK